MHNHPLWMLLPWTVFAVGAALQFWRITGAFRSGARVRQRLERIWRMDQPPP
jgi:hypothetical protein